MAAQIAAWPPAAMRSVLPPTIAMPAMFLHHAAGALRAALWLLQHGYYDGLGRRSF